MSRAIGTPAGQQGNATADPAQHGDAAAGSSGQHQRAATLPQEQPEDAVQTSGQQRTLQYIDVDPAMLINCEQLLVEIRELAGMDSRYRTPQICAVLFDMYNRHGTQRHNPRRKDAATSKDILSRLMRLPNGERDVSETTRLVKSLLRPFTKDDEGRKKLASMRDLIDVITEIPELHPTTHGIATLVRAFFGSDESELKTLVQALVGYKGSDIATFLHNLWKEDDATSISAADHRQMLSIPEQTLLGRVRNFDSRDRELVRTVLQLATDLCGGRDVPTEGRRDTAERTSSGSKTWNPFNSRNKR